MQKAAALTEHSAKAAVLFFSGLLLCFAVKKEPSCRTALFEK